MDPRITITPYPTHATVQDGRFTFTPQTAVVADPAAAGSAAFLRADFARAAGWNLPEAPVPGAPRVEFRIDPALSQLGKEGYILQVSPTLVLAKAAAPNGAFYALQSLRQLLPVALDSATPTAADWSLPCVEIQDQPRFSWRGSHMDVGRHFMPKAFVLKYLDVMARYKLNTLHWHLTEDQGWRIEIKKYPRLTEVGAWRKQTMVGHFEGIFEGLTYDGIPHGGYYTQDEVREVVAYARERFINVVPEIEMPGHSQAAIAAYPELGNTGKALEVAEVWGIYEPIYNANESTLLFLQDVLTEVMALFPSEFIHIGGDEAPKKQWQESPAAQARIRELGLKDEDELQSYFIRRMDQFLTAHGRRLIGWDEILEGGLAENATVMSWRGEAGGIAAANAGHDVVMAPTQYTYFDNYQSMDYDNEPLAIGGYVPLDVVYEYNPIPADIAPDKAHHVLGTQGQLWTEYIKTPEHLEYMAFPRLIALAETAWTPMDIKEYDAFLARLKMELSRLDLLKVNYRKLD